MPERAYTYSGQIKISRDDMSLLRRGIKKCTVRMGKASVASEQIVLTDGRSRVPVRVTKVDQDRQFKDISDQDAQDEGFQTREELIADLRRFYPRAQPEDRITVIYFEALDAPNLLF